MPVDVPEALATQTLIPLGTNRLRGFLDPRLAQLRHELEQGNPSSRAFGLVLQSLAYAFGLGFVPARCARAC